MTAWKNLLKWCRRNNQLINNLCFVIIKNNYCYAVPRGQVQSLLKRCDSDNQKLINIYIDLRNKYINLLTFKSYDVNSLWKKQGLKWAPKPGYYQLYQII